MDEKQPDLAKVQVPSKGGEPQESKSPAFTPGPNPELADDKKVGGDDLVRKVTEL
jgi:hypothetical protein